MKEDDADEDDSNFTLLVSCSISETGDCEKDVIDTVLDSMGRDTLEDVEVWLAAPCQVAYQFPCSAFAMCSAMLT